jgi:hypothetical protein
MSLLLRPQFVALDTGQLVNWLRDRASDGEKKKTALKFEGQLREFGLVLILTNHHLLELAAINNGDLVTARLRALSALPLVATPAPITKDTPLGDIIDISAAEALAALDASGASAIEVSKRVNATALRVLSGEDALAPYMLDPFTLHHLAKRNAEKQRETVAISHLSPELVSKMRILEFVEGAFRSSSDAVRVFSEMKETLGKRIAAHGDKRITDPQQVAHRFYEDALSTAAEFNAADVREFFEAGLAKLNVSMADISPETTIEEALDLGLFRTELKIAVSKVGRPWTHFLNLDPLRLPSWQIKYALKKYAHRRHELRGSITNDRYLACLAPYSNATFADAQTMEDARRATHQVPLLQVLLRSLTRSASYSKVPGMLAFHGTQAA